jgi:DNA-directed RNA polymerase
MAEVAKMLSESALDLGFRHILKDLGHFTMSHQGKHFLDDVPEVMPVQAVRLNNLPIFLFSYNHCFQLRKGPDDTKEFYTPFNISALRHHLQDVIEAKTVLENNIDARQEHLEASVYDLAIEQFEHRSAAFQDNTPRNPDLQHWIWTWHTAFEKHIAEVIKTAQLMEYKPGRARKGESPEWALMKDILPCLSSISTQKLSLLTILELLRLQGTSGVPSGMKAAGALIAIGRAVENEYKVEICRQSKIPVADYSIKKGNYFSNMGYKHLHERRLAAAKSQDLDERWQGDWSQAMRSKVGAFLVNAFESVAEVTRTKKDPKTGEIMFVFRLLLHPVLLYSLTRFSFAVGLRNNPPFTMPTNSCEAIS